MQELLAEHDILVIADEVVTGFGRTGVWFATGLFDLTPDIVTLAKGITSAYFPLSASVISENLGGIARHLAGDGTADARLHLFGASGRGAVGLANLDIMETRGPRR